MESIRRQRHDLLRGGLIRKEQSNRRENEARKITAGLHARRRRKPSSAAPTALSTPSDGSGIVPAA